MQHDIFLMKIKQNLFHLLPVKIKRNIIHKFVQFPTIIQIFNTTL